MTNGTSAVLYLGATSNLERRVWEHNEKVHDGFAERYNVNRLVYCEEFTNVKDAIAREKQIKCGSRRKRIKLVNSVNPQWLDPSGQS